MSELVGRVFHSTVGCLGVVISPRGVAAITRPRKDEAEARSDLFASCPGLSLSALQVVDKRLDELIEKLTAYFAGQPVVFAESVDLSRISEFDQRVLAVVRDIGYGETRSYGWIAGQIGLPRAARAVGQALHRNPVPVVIPCHRVVAANGALCGFGWGLELKQWLIETERRCQFAKTESRIVQNSGSFLPSRSS